MFNTSVRRIRAAAGDRNTAAGVAGDEITLDEVERIAI